MAPVVLVVAVVALAASCTPPAPEAARPLASAGGWDRLALTDGTLEPAATYEGLARTAGGRWVAYGSVALAAGRRRQPALWQSADGRRWDAVALAAPGATAVGSVRALASDPTTAVAVGADGAGAEAVPAVWTSTDGVTWDGPARLVGPDGGWVATGVARVPAGGWLAVAVPADGRRTPPQLWRSDDGRRWSRVDVDWPVGSDLVAGGGAVAGTAGDRAVVLAEAGDVAGTGRRLTVASTADGRAVEVATLDGATAIDAATTAVDGGGRTQPPALVVGVRADAAAPSELRRTADGRTWTSLGQPAGDARVSSLAVDGTGATTVVAADGRLRTAAAGSSSWADLSPPPAARTERDRAARSARPVQVAAGADRLAVLQSGTAAAVDVSAAGGGEWSSSSPGALPGSVRRQTTTVTGLAAGDALVVAVGTVERRPLDDGDPAAVRSEARAWWSKDGLLWQEAILSSALESLVGVARRGTGFVAVGRGRDAAGRPEALLLASPDGKDWSLAGRLPDGADPAAVLATPAGAVVLGSARSDGATGSPAATGTTGPVGAAPSGGGGRPSGDERAAAWTTADGRTWATVDLGALAGAGSALVGGCSRDGELVAVGRAGAAGGGAAAALVLTSPDGSAWTPVDLGASAGPAGRQATGCTVDRAGELLVVGAGGPADPTGAGAWGWRRPAPGATAAGPVTLLPGVPAAAVGRSSGWFVAGGTSAAAGPGSVLVWTSDAGGDAGGSTGVAPWPYVRAPLQVTADGQGGALVAATRFRDRSVVAGTLEDAGLVLLGPG